MSLPPSALQSIHLKPHPLALTIAALLASHGYRKGSLSLSGAVGAGVVGYLHLANDNPVFGVGLLSFYAIGTIATKYKASIKARLEEGHEKGKEAGGRTAWQVLSNSLPSLLSSLLYRFLYTSERYSPLVKYVDGLGVGGGFRRGLVMGGLGHLACCFGDTLSSELGILSPTPPLLLTTLRPCPPGTNGAISPLGTGVAFLAGAGMGALFWAFERGREAGGLGWWFLVGGAAGLGGSLVSSFAWVLGGKGGTTGS